MTKYSLFILMLLLSGCQRETFVVQTDYLSEENLASYHVGTPDPLLNCPPVGQRMYVKWKIPEPLFCSENLYIKVVIRFRNREEETVIIDKLDRKGSYIYYLLQENYFQKEGILTYKVMLMSGDTILDQWLHQLWVDRIVILPEDVNH